MKSFIWLLALCLAVFPASSKANEPPVPPGGLSFYYEFACSDQETGEKGYCFLGKTVEGRNYLTMWQGDDLMVIREIVGDGYVPVWKNPLYASY